MEGDYFETEGDGYQCCLYCRISLRQSETLVLLCCGVKWQWEAAWSINKGHLGSHEPLKGALKVSSLRAHQQMDALCVDEKEGGCDCVVVFLLSFV